MADLLRRSDARQAHPSFEHLLPIHIGAGAAGSDSGKQLWTLPQGSMDFVVSQLSILGIHSKISKDFM
jgi:4,5-DOPA dioxygenase extradiol